MSDHKTRTIVVRVVVTDDIRRAVKHRLGSSSIATIRAECASALSAYLNDIIADAAVEKK